MDLRRPTLFTLLFLALSVSAALGAHWQFAGWYGGGCYPYVEFDPNNKGRVYLTSDVAGIWRSDNLGERWEFVNEGLGNATVMQVVVAPSNSNVLYAATDSGVYRSDDASMHWRPCGRPIFGSLKFRRPENYRCLAVAPQAADVLVAGTKFGDVYLSKNGGRTWRDLGHRGLRRGKGGAISSLQWSADGTKLYAASPHGLAVYADGRWSVLGAAPKDISDFLVRGNTSYAAAKDGLYLSRDGGTSFSKTSPPVKSGVPYRVDALPDEQGGKIWVGWMRDWKGDIVSSSDGGKTWSAEDTVMRADEYSDPTRKWVGNQSRTSSVKVDPFDPNTLIRSDWWGVWKSTDGGATWDEKITGAPNTVGSDLHISPDGVIYAATMDNGLMKSPDEGNTYIPVYPSKGYHAEINGHVWRVISPEPGRVVATSSPWNAKLNQIVTSDDSINYTRTRAGLPAGRPRKNTVWGEGYPRALAFDSKEPKRVYLGIDGDDGGGLFISDDGGKSWKRSSRQPGSLKVYNGLAVDPTDSNRLYWGGLGWKGGVYMSEDKGKSWHRVFSRMKDVFDVAVAPDGTVYAAGYDRGPCVYISFPGGHGWRLFRRFPGDGSAESVAFDPEDPRRVVVAVVNWSGVTGGRLYVRMRTGWRDLTGDLPESQGAAALAFHPKNGYLYLISYAGSVYRTSFKDLRAEDAAS